MLNVGKKKGSCKGLRVQLKNKNEVMCGVCDYREETDANLESQSDVSSHNFGVVCSKRVRSPQICDALWKMLLFTT